MISVAIDGPSGAGKSTLSRAAAKQLGFLYVDTGAMYRAVGLAALRDNVNPKDGAAVAALLPQLDIGLQHKQGEQRIFLNGEDVSAAIRDEAVGMAASAVSAHETVRAFLLDSQRRLARENNVIMDGRDIGTVVLPGATVKIFLTADVGERARRRWRELLEKGQPADYETVLDDVQTRDYNDSHRAAAPLKQAEDALLVDTTGKDFQQSLIMVLDVVKSHISKGD